CGVVGFVSLVTFRLPCPTACMDSFPLPYRWHEISANGELRRPAADLGEQTVAPRRPARRQHRCVSRRNSAGQHVHGVMGAQNKYGSYFEKNDRDAEIEPAVIAAEPPEFDCAQDS